MKIAFVEIQNFRKLRACRVEFAEQETILVGANNSGKTSAMDALICFLKQSPRNAIATTDFTLSNWSSIDQLGAQWVGADEGEEPAVTLDSWLPLLPALDIWLNVDEKDLHRVAHLLPTLDWTLKCSFLRPRFRTDQSTSDTGPSRTQHTTDTMSAA